MLCLLPVLLLPAAVYLTLNVLFLFVPYFRADSRSVDSSALRSLLRFTLFVLAAVVGEIMRMKRKKRRELEAAQEDVQ